MIISLKRFSVIVLCAWLSFVATATAAETNSAASRDSQSIVNEMRLKKLTRDLELTDAQQKKVQALLNEEAKTIAPIKEDSTLAFTNRVAKLKAAQEATYAKIKPLLTPAQLEKFEKMQAAAIKPKKKK